jgi:hypothetical protein
MRMIRRSLFDTVKMLQKEGIDADARLVGKDVILSMAYPISGGVPWTRKFGRNELPRAAEAMVAAAITLYPSCALAKVTELVASAIAATKPRV